MTTTLGPVRERMVELMKATVADEKAHHDWTYYEVRPLAIPPRFYPGEHVRADCSKGAQFIAFWAGSQDDPLGMGFGVWGNSYSATAHLEHVASASMLHPGDYVTFDGPGHMTVVYEAGTDPLLWSHGHQGAPEFYRLSADRRARHYLLNPAPVAGKPHPHRNTLAENLRERTGYWSWHQWRTGHGAWERFGPHNPKVRPNVPHRVPHAWWVKFVQQQLSTHSPNRSPA